MTEKREKKISRNSIIFIGAFFAIIAIGYFLFAYESPITSYPLNVESVKRDPRIEILLSKSELTEPEFIELKELLTKEEKEYKKTN